MNDYDKLIAEYSADYCFFLEAAYGQGMMSEGGHEAIDKLFASQELAGKKILDVGCGLGGAVFYIAEKYGVAVTGLELNPWMVQEATRRIPAQLKNQVKFVTYKDVPYTEFENEYFDIIFSKGVLTHVKEKACLFKELNRILKTNGVLLIDDWLSPKKNYWDKRVQKMCEVENLTLYAETEDGYIQLLKNSGFSNIKMVDRNIDYARYNQCIVDTITSKRNRDKFIEQFDEKTFLEAVEAYQLIADSIKDNALLIRGFSTEK